MLADFDSEVGGVGLVVGVDGGGVVGADAGGVPTGEVAEDGLFKVAYRVDVAGVPF